MIAMKSYWYIIRYMDCMLGHWEMKSSWSAPSSPNLMVVLLVLCHGHDGFDRDDVSDFLVEILHQPEAHLVRGKNVYSIP